jgi:phage anti-repressor protein
MRGKFEILVEKSTKSHEIDRKYFQKCRKNHKSLQKNQQSHETDRKYLQK